MPGTGPPEYPTSAGQTPPDYPASTEDVPPEDSASGEQPAGALGYGMDAAQPLVEISGDEGIESANILAFAHGIYVASFERSGGFAADDVFTRRFVDGDLAIAPGDLQRQTCDHIERDRRRFAHDDRNRVLRQLVADPKLDGCIAGLVDACIAWELSCRPAGSDASLPTVAARFMVRRAIEDLQRHASNAGGGGVGLVAKESTDQLVECTSILGHEDIDAYVPGRHLFDRIAWLTPNGQYPTAEEARRTMTKGAVARRLFIEVANDTGQLETISDGAIETICAFAVEHQFAQGTIGVDGDEVASRRRMTADEHDRKVIYFRGRRSA